jgi:hypothetical protein
MMKHIVVLCNSANTPKNNLAGSHIDFSFSIPDSKGILTVLLFYHIKWQLLGLFSLNP